jgi:hypothetical protein
MSKIPKKINQEARDWLVGKTIERVKVVKPIMEERTMYEHVLGPSALKIYFTDGSTTILETWIGEFLLKPSKLNGVKNKRSRSYFTISRKEGSK